MPERCKQRRVCYINMLKKFYVDCSTQPLSESSLTVSITSHVASGETVKQDEEGPIDEDFVDAGVRLTVHRNSDVLANLNNKFSHLSTEERNNVAKFTHLFPDTPKRELKF